MSLVKQLKQVSPVSIIVGLLVAQGVSASLAMVMVFGFALVYGNKVMVAIFEYTSSVVTASAIGLLSMLIAGYSCMLLPRPAMVNPLIVGSLTLALNIWVWVLLDGIYGSEHQWIMLITAILTIPSAMLGGYIGIKKGS